jgi:type III secretory pathway component EscS
LADGPIQPIDYGRVTQPQRQSFPFAMKIAGVILIVTMMALIAGSIIYYWSIPRP